MYEKIRTYAPERVANLFMSRPFHFFTSDEVAEELELPIQNVRCIIRRLVEEKIIVHSFAKTGRKQSYYFIGN